MQLRRVKIDTEQDKRIVIGMIVSTDFLAKVVDHLNLDYFEQRHLKLLVEWCVDFYDRHKQAPFLHIGDVLKQNSKGMDESDVRLIEEILSELSKKYETDAGINVSYLFEQALHFFRKRELEIIQNNIRFYLDKDELDNAEAELRAFKKIEEKTSEWIQPFKPDRAFEAAQNKYNPIFTLPGDLGKFLGPFCESWLVGIEGGYKRGKTWFVNEIAVMAALSKIPVAFIELEMPWQQEEVRIYRRLFSIGDDTRVIIPIFDCKKNQHNQCGKRRRLGSGLLYDEEEEKPRYHPSSTWVPCDVCRKDDRSAYEMAIWYKTVDRPVDNPYYVRKQMEKIDKKFGKYFWLRSFPKFSANVRDIEHSLDELEHFSGFVPRIICVDHADIIGPETKGQIGVQKEDETWMALGRLAAERKACVVVPTQVTTEALEAAIIKERHTGRWRGKLGHVEAMFTMNQTEGEMDEGIMRIAVKEHRHIKHSKTATCTLCQNYGVGQFHLDSYAPTIR